MEAARAAISRYVVRRFLIFVVTVWVAASVNFIVPRLVPGDPIGACIQNMTLQGASVTNGAQIIAAYRKIFGLDQPLYIQYVRYLANTVHFNFGYSLTAFPTPVSQIIAESLPWTVGLLGTTTILSFVIGTLFGALLGWAGSPRLARIAIPFFMILAAVPYYLFAILLLFLLAFTLHWFPSSGSTQIGVVYHNRLAEVRDILNHSILPALSILLSAFGGWPWACGMMIVTSEQDYLTLAQAKGSTRRRVFFGYAMRNALLPQITAFAIALGGIASAVLVRRFLLPRYWLPPLSGH